MDLRDTSASTNGRGSEKWLRSWTHLRIDRRSTGYCRVTFDHPPVNNITATTVLELAELVDLIEHDADLNVVVFASADPEFYLAGYDAAGTTGVNTWLDLLARLSRAPVVSIASIRGHVVGAGCEFVLACDVRYASRENTLVANDLNGPCAERNGYVHRVIADDRLDHEVEEIAWRLARFDRAAIAGTKSYVGLRPGRAGSRRPVAHPPARGGS
jgi:enoyl-CoA hydratase/carnithine racemase